MNPHDLSLRSRNRYETFLLLWCGSVLTTLSSPFGMGTTPAGVGGCTPNYRNDVMLAVTFFGSRRSLSTYINQSLENVLEDVTTFGRVSQHLVVQAVIRVVGLTHLLKMSSLRKLQSIVLVE